MISIMITKRIELPILIILSTYISIGHARQIPMDEYFAFSNITNVKRDGSMAYILPPGLFPETPTPTTTKPKSTSTAKAKTTTSAPPLPTTFPPDGESINMGNRVIQQNHFKYFNFDLPSEGITFSLENRRGYAFGYYSYTNPTPNELKNDGTIPPGATFIKFRKSYRKQDTYHTRASVFVGVKGLGLANTARLKVIRGDYVMSKEKDLPPTEAY